MTRTLISHTLKRIGKTVLVQGWVHTRRDHGKIVFIDLRDRTGLLQTVLTSDLAGSLHPEDVVSFTGLVKSRPEKLVNPNLATGTIELATEKVETLSKSADELPIPVIEKNENETDLAKRLDCRWVDLRKPQNLLIFKTWTHMEKAFRDYWTSNNYIEIHSPKLMSSPSESKSELFSLPYFGTTAYLAQSPQFYKQMAMASGFERVFEVGPVFRANPSFTSRHDTEFTGYDMEISFINSHQDVIKEESRLISHALKSMRKILGEEIKDKFGTETVVPKLPFPQVTMAQAKKILAERGVPSETDGDLNPEEERQLSQYIQEKHGHEFVFVTEYPASVRPFYHMRPEGNPKITKSFDLLWKGLEITTGAQREHRYDILKSQAVEKGLNPENLEHYFSFFKYGCPPHGGLGFGPSRFVMKLLGLSNVREVTYLYRGVNRLTP